MPAAQMSLPTSDILEFDRRRASARTEFGIGTNDLARARTRAETDYGRTARGQNLGGGAFGALDLSFRQQREGIPGQFQGRGLINSGIFKNALNRHFKAKTTALDDLQIQFARTFQDFDSTSEGLGLGLERALADISGDEQLRRTVYAELIRNGQ